MAPIEQYLAPAIGDGDYDQLVTLFSEVYPNQAQWLQMFVDGLEQGWLGYAGPDEFRPRRYVVRRAGRIVVNATVRPRKVKTTRGHETIAGLCDVISHPEVRGCGYAKEVMHAVFSTVDHGEFSFSLFQTAGARGFYEKLRCKVVDNSIVNSCNIEDPTSNPFWEPWVMGYAGAGELPKGEIDLLGAGY